MRGVFVLIFCASFWAFGQDPDSLAVSDDEVNTSFFNERPDDSAPADTATVSARAFDQSTVDRLKSDPDLEYGTEPTIAETLWERFKRWLAQFFASFFRSATTTNWGRVFTYAFLTAVLVVIIMMMLKVNAFRVFIGGEGVIPLKHHVLDDNIHEMDFEKLIQEALARQDYRLGVRLLFLCSLKMLSDKNHIHWMQGKTNHDYLNELNAGDMKQGFHELNYYFEYAWYGNFAVTDTEYSRVKQTFDEWRRKI
jgi:hypothetical protein